MKAIITLLALIIGSSFLAGCGHELFSADANYAPSNVSGRRIDTYYEGDSAVMLREQRRKSGEMGFGYPSGAVQQ